jgi:hypothetical protein
VTPVGQCWGKKRKMVLYHVKQYYIRRYTLQSLPDGMRGGERAWAEFRQAYATCDLWRKLNASTQHSDNKPCDVLQSLLKAFVHGPCSIQLHVVQFVL